MQQPPTQPLVPPALPMESNIASETKPLLILSNMPWHIRQRIVDKTDTWTKLSLRQCSFAFKNHFMLSDVFYKQLTVFHRRDSVDITLFIDDKNKLLISFQREERGCLVRNKLRNHTNFIENGHYLEKAAEHVKKIFSHPRVLLGKLKFACPDRDDESDDEESDEDEFDEAGPLGRVSDELIVKIQSSLHALGRPLAVTKFSTRTKADLSYCLDFLKVLDPNRLKGFKTTNPEKISRSVTNLSDFAETPHWPNLNMFSADSCNINIPYKELKHLDIYRGSIKNLGKALVKEIVEEILSERKLRDIWISFKESEKIDIGEYLTRRLDKVDKETDLNSDSDSDLDSDLDSEEYWKRTFPDINETVRIRKLDWSDGDGNIEIKRSGIEQMRFRLN